VCQYSVGSCYNLGTCDQIDRFEAVPQDVRVDPNRLERIVKDLGLSRIDCPSCYGTGRFQGDRRCQTCGVCCGSGHLWRSSTVCVTDDWLKELDRSRR
jgi:hypothetical protein